MVTFLDGKKIAAKIYSSIEQTTLSVKPGLAVIIVGEDFASQKYVAMKQKKCNLLGFYSKICRLSSTSSEEEVISAISKYNNDSAIHGILVQLPLPQHLSQHNVLSAIAPIKDVEGIGPFNTGLLAMGKPRFIPCTPLAIVKLLEAYNLSLSGKHVVIVNHSSVVGKPLSLLLLEKEATITVCHVKTKNLDSYTLRADVLISATGVHGLITSDMVKEGAVVIDAGISSAGGKLAGDVTENVDLRASYISKVPGGVGPMTVACLLLNTFKAAKLASE